MSDDLKTRVLKHLLEAVDTELDPDAVTADMQLREDLGLDSLGAVEMVMELEDEFDVKLSDEELVELKTVGDVFTLVEQKQQSTETG